MVGLLPRVQRWLAPLVVAALMVPSAGMLFTSVQSRSTAENRMLAAAPAWPRTLAGWRALPRGVDAYLADHFAFRQVLTAAANQLHWRLGGQLDGGAVVRGKDDRLFLRDNLLDITGGVINTRVADDYSRFVCDMNAKLTARALPMVFAMAPSPAAIYPEALPDWVPRGRASASDRILARTKACGVAAVDLRPPLLAAKPSGSIYFHHDTHWTPKGALIAYNALAMALKRPEWRVDVHQLVWRRTHEQNQDLARLSGAGNLPVEPMETPDLTARTDSLHEGLMNGVSDYGARASFIDETGHPGLTVLVIGDSFSADFMAPDFAAAVGRFAWIHQQGCGFDWRVFDAVKPDYVILMPTDRFASCSKGRRPHNWPG
ncbi:MAG: alginate O-acetyltransferase AlgX-related protein [Caulobacteraceae bacterium]